MKPALLLIDFCQDFFTEGRLLAGRARLARAANELARGFREAGHPVIWVRQEFAPDLSDAFLAMRRSGARVTIRGTPGAALLPELEVRDGDLEVVKKRYSAFFGTELEALLAARGVARVVLAGVNTHACVRTAAVDAYQRDLHVTLADEAVDSYDERFHAESKRYLEGRVGTFLPVAEILATLDGGTAP